MSSNTRIVAIRRPLLAALALALGLLVMPHERSTAQAATYAIGWHAIGNGAHASRNDCFTVSGTIGQPALQPSMGSTYAILPGYLAAAPTAARDTIFYNGFERCAP